jgi:aminopeptidase YwaD
MTRLFKGLILILISLIPVAGCQAQNASSITSGELRKHVEYLASQQLAGRYPGTSGDRAAAEYIRNCLTGYGLKPMMENGFQTFQVTTGIKKGSANAFSINGKAAVPDTDFTPVSISENGKVDASVVFLGYGFRIKSDTLTWDDYAGLNVKGRLH